MEMCLLHNVSMLETVSTKTVFSCILKIENVYLDSGWLLCKQAALGCFSLPGLSSWERWCPRADAPERFIQGASVVASEARVPLGNAFLTLEGRAIFASSALLRAPQLAGW